LSVGRAARGTDLFYEVKGEGPPLVLLNGLSQSTVNWMTQSRKLSRAFQVVTYDARGQGQSPPPSGVLDLARHVEDLRDLLDHLGLERAHLCGFSFGARVALGFAARYPSRVDRLVLTSAGAGEAAYRRVIVRSWYEVLRTGGAEAMAWCVIPHILGRRFLEKYERQIPGMVRATLQRNSVEGMLALLEGYRDFPAPTEDARAVRAPTLLLSADEDPLVGPDSVQELLGSIPDARHILIRGCGHTIPIEEPEVWGARVEEFCLPQAG
jgi:3-oxoadipate enol-lactonase